MSNIGGATVSPVHGGGDNIPPTIFSTNIQVADAQSNLLNYRSMRDSVNISSSSPLRRSPKGQIVTTAQLKERESLATQVASMNHSTMADKINLTTAPTAGHTTVQYSPLRSKTPPAGVREAKEADAKQLQN